MLTLTFRNRLQLSLERRRQMLVSEVAKFINISVRTLHHYDEIGLLSPDVLENGYRVYAQSDLEILQQILFFRELGFTLKQIKALLKSPEFDRLQTLELQRTALIERRQRTELMIETIEQTIQQAKGEVQMTKEDIFKGFDFGENPYEEEARKRYGDEVVEESAEKIDALNKNGGETVGKEMERIFKSLTALMNQRPESEPVQQEILEWYK